MKNVSNNRRKAEGKKTGKIASKILLSVIAITVLVVLLFGLVIGGIVRMNVDDLSMKYAQSQVEANVNEIDKDFLIVEKLVDSLSAEIAVEVDVDKAMDDIGYLRDFTDAYEIRLREIGLETQVANSIYVFFNNSFFGDVADVWLYTDEFVRQPRLEMEYFETYNEWYNLPIDEGVTRWTFPFVGATESTKETLVTSYVTPIKKDGQIIGLVGMDLDLKDISQTLDSVQLYDTGYLYMMDPDGNIIVHKNVPWEDTDNDGYPDTSVNVMDIYDYGFLLDDMRENDQGLTNYIRNDGVHVTAAFGHLTNGWVVASSIPTNEVYAINRLLTLIGIVIGLIAIGLSIVGGILISKSISQPIIGVVGALEQIKKGDFRTRVQSKSNDETRLLADSLNEMVGNISNLIVDSKTATSKLVDSSTTLASMVEETNATIEQVSSTVNEISKGTQDTAGEAERSTRVVRIMDDKFKTIIQSSDSMYEQTQKVGDRKESGLEAIKTLREISNSSQVSNEKIYHAVGQLDSRTKAITDIISTINSIASQTNLLALNASIEAARAGEAGKGFAVVADEIRKLAEDSSAATDEIRNIIQIIQTDTKETVTIMEEVNEISKDQNEAVTNVDNIFDTIFKAIDDVIQGIQDISIGLTDVKEQKDQIVEISSTLSAVSEETAAATEEVNASMMDQMQAIEEVARNADLLSELAMNLREHIDVFQVEE